MRTSFFRFLLCINFPASGVVDSNALSVHYFFLFKYHCFPFDIVLQMFRQNASCYFDDKSTVYKCRIGVFRLWNAFKQILPHPSMKLLINIFNQTFVWAKQFDTSNSFPGFFFLPVVIAEFKKQNKLNPWFSINKNTFINAVSIQNVYITSSFW